MAATGRSRTVKSLAVLLIAMAVGTCVLIRMETPPACLTIPLQAGGADDQSQSGRPGRVAVIRQTEVPIQYIKWCNIIVHDAGGRCGRGLPRTPADSSGGRTHPDGYKPDGGCHFLIGSSETIGDGVIRPTRLWRRQLDGNHIVVPGYYYNENSIGIRLLCDTGRAAPSPKQLAALADVVRALQVICQIPPDHVYLHSELGAPGCPGRFFPADIFRSRLIRARR